MKTAATQPEVLIKGLRTNLKDLLAKELQQLPGYLEGLTTKEKLDYLLKLMPYVLPKVGNIEHNNGEPFSWG